MLNDVVDVLPENRLKIEFVGGVEVSGDGFGVAVDHDGLVAAFFGCQHTVHARVVEFNTLADAVGARTQNHHFRAIADHTFVFVFKSRVIVRRFGFKLSSAGVYQLVDAIDTEVFSFLIYFGLEAA